MATRLPNSIHCATLNVELLKNETYCKQINEYIEEAISDGLVDEYELWATGLRQIGEKVLGVPVVSHRLQKQVDSAVQLQTLFAIQKEAFAIRDRSEMDRQRYLRICEENKKIFSVSSTNGGPIRLGKLKLLMARNPVPNTRVTVSAERSADGPTRSFSIVQANLYMLSQDALTDGGNTFRFYLMSQVRFHSRSWMG